MDRSLVVFLYRGTSNIAVREHNTPEIPDKNRLAKTRGHRHILSLCRRKPNGFLLPRVERYAGTSAHDNCTRDIPSVIGLMRILRVHVQLPLNSITQTPLKSDTTCTRRFNVHHDVQCWMQMHQLPSRRVSCQRSNLVNDVRAGLVHQSHQMPPIPGVYHISSIRYGLATLSCICRFRSAQR